MLFRSVVKLQIPIPFVLPLKIPVRNLNNMQYKQPACDDSQPMGLLDRLLLIKTSINLTLKYSLIFLTPFKMIIINYWLSYVDFIMILNIHIKDITFLKKYTRGRGFDILHSSIVLVLNPCSYRLAFQFALLIILWLLVSLCINFFV